VVSSNKNDLTDCSFALRSFDRWTSHDLRASKLPLPPMGQDGEGDPSFEASRAGGRERALGER